MILRTTLFGNVYNFSDVKEVLAKANEEKSGDRLAGIIAGSTAERVPPDAYENRWLLRQYFPAGLD